MRPSISHTETKFINTLGATMFTYILVAGQAADVLTTLIFAEAKGLDGQRAFPHIEEANPLMAPLVNESLWWDIVTIKALVTIAAVTFIMRMAHRPRLRSRLAATLVAAAGSAWIWGVVVNNLYVMGALGG